MCFCSLESMDSLQEQEDVMSKAQLFSSAKRDGGFAPNNFSYPISFLTKFLKLAAA